MEKLIARSSSSEGSDARFGPATEKHKLFVSMMGIAKKLRFLLAE